MGLVWGEAVPLDVGGHLLTANPIRGRCDRSRDVAVIRACAWIAAALAAGVVLDLLGAWIWLSFIKDGPEFPY